MAAPDPAGERAALQRSIVATAVLGLLGVTWGVATRSQMILLDGVYAVIGIVVSWLLLRASALAAAGPTRSYPFGREGFTPFVIGIQGFVLLATLVYAAAEGIFTIRAGGSNVAAGGAIVYAVIAAAGSVAFWMWLHRAAGDSDLLAAESMAWRVGALRGAGMLVGFVAIAILDGSSWDGAAPYVDPAMVLITCALFIGTPVRLIRTMVVELLERAPDAPVHDAVLGAVAEVRADFELDEPAVRMTKVGPKLYVEVDGRAGPDVTIRQEHEVRESLRQRLDDLPFDVWLTVELRPRPPA
jgi:predicted Co/Zn/Cd cation transporter (cation efflux family)